MTTSSSLARRPTTAERVLTLLAEQGGAEGLTRADIARALSVPLGTVDRAVIALLERGAARRANDSEFLDLRRRTAAAGTLAVVGLYQFGLIRSVPEPPLPGVDADRVIGLGEHGSVPGRAPGDSSSVTAWLTGPRRPGCRGRSRPCGRSGW